MTAVTPLDIVRDLDRRAFALEMQALGLREAAVVLRREHRLPSSDPSVHKLASEIVAYRRAEMALRDAMFVQDQVVDPAAATDRLEEGVLAILDESERPVRVARLRELLNIAPDDKARQRFTYLLRRLAARGLITLTDRTKARTAALVRSAPGQEAASDAA